MTRMFWMLVTFISMSSLSACRLGSQLNPTVQEHDLKRKSILLPAEDYSVVSWYPDGRLMFFLDTDNQSIQYVISVEGTINELQLEFDARCQRIKYLVNPTPLPNGQMGVIEICGGRWPERAVGRLADEMYLMSYDWEGDSLKQIVAAPLMSGLGAGRFTWNPDMSRGIQEATSLIGTLYWITPDSIEPMDITIGEVNRSWSLAENMTIEASNDSEIYLNKRDVGVASAPAWSSDGEVIALMASTDAINRSGASRGLGEHSLYLIDPIEQQAEAILDQIYYPHLLIWSPDNQWLAFNAAYGKGKNEGLWLFSPTQNILHLVDEGNFKSFAWSPNGQEIAALYCPDDLCYSAGVAEPVLYDVKSLVQPSP